MRSVTFLIKMFITIRKLLGILKDYPEESTVNINWSMKESFAPQAALLADQIHPNLISVDSIKRNLRTIEESEALPSEVKNKLLSDALGQRGNDIPPHCTCIKTVERLQLKSYGFKCNSCGEILGFDLVRLKESPFNK